MRSQARQGGAVSARRRDAHGRPGRRELLPAAPRGLRPRAGRRPRRGGGADPRRGRGDRGEVEAILLTHTPLRPHRRRRAGGGGDRGAGLLPARSRCRCSPTSWPSSPGRASAPTRATTPTRPSPAARRSSSPGSRSTSSSPRATAPATSPTRSAARTAIFSGDVLFQGSVGRVDLPGGDWPTLIASIGTLLDTHPDETVVYPGHMGITTLGAERATNPFLASLAR